MGHQVKVVSTELYIMQPMAPQLDPSISVERVFPGPIVGIANMIEKRLSSKESSDSALMFRDESAIRERIYRGVRKALNHIIFPDVRSEWYWHARAHLDQLFGKGYKPDIVIGSHEPAIDLQLAVYVKRRFGVPCIGDFADPVDSVYSPRWRHLIDRWYEKKLLKDVDRAVVTVQALKDEFVHRHGLDEAHIEVVPQGFDALRTQLPAADKRLRSDRLNIVFTGTLYAAFRNPEKFIAAVLGRRDVDLWIAGNIVGAVRMPGGVSNIHVLGPMEHEQALALQCSADVLLNIGNLQACQIPGKIYEYIGAGRPILHLFEHPKDPTIELVSSLGRGWIVPVDSDAIAKVLDELVSRWNAGEIDRGIDLNSAHLHSLTWHGRAGRLAEIVEELLQESAISRS
jgi:hypothetical protein